TVAASPGGGVAVLAGALAATLAVWAVVALVASSLLDALDVSATTLYLGAGALVLNSVVRRTLGRAGATSTPATATTVPAALVAVSLLVTPAPTMVVLAVAGRAGVSSALAGALAALVAVGLLARPGMSTDLPRSHLALVAGAVVASQMVLVGAVGL
ncbi:MAG: hypothetical protein S0880_24170, partial [Actinomycetota bacterium]|nr:hypothetical protein [Actinomycetota bacterium]